MVDHARDDGYGLVPLPDNIRLKLRGLRDGTGAPVRGLDVYTKQWIDSFEFEFVEESRLTGAERGIFARRGEIATLAGGWPKVVRDVVVSTTMRPGEDGRADAVGLWEPQLGRIIVKRDQLHSLKDFAGTLLHEIVHARSGEVDVSRGFESALTDLIAQLATTALLAASQAAPSSAAVATVGPVVPRSNSVKKGSDKVRATTVTPRRSSKTKPKPSGRHKQRKH